MILKGYTKLNTWDWTRNRRDLFCKWRVNQLEMKVYPCKITLGLLIWIYVALVLIFIPEICFLGSFFQIKKYDFFFFFFFCRSSPNRSAIRFWRSTFFCPSDHTIRSSRFATPLLSAHPPARLANITLIPINPLPTIIGGGIITVYYPPEYSFPTCKTVSESGKHSWYINLALKKYL